MPKLVDEIIDTYEKHVGKEVKLHDMPGEPNVRLPKNEGEPVDITQYRSITGKYMYLVCKILPEGANVVRDLMRHFSNPGEEHWKAIEYIVRHLKKIRKDIKLTFRKPKEM